MLPALLHTACAASVSILFLGNSHTANFDVPNQVKAILEAGGGPRVPIKTLVGATLEGLATSRQVVREVESSAWSVVVLQGAQLSMSRKVEYAQDGAIQLARTALGRGARVLWFAEWPRKGIDETPYILGVYGKIAKDAGGEVVPLGYATEAAVKRAPKVELWSGDGNHASAEGAYLAAQTLSLWITRGAVSRSEFVAPQISSETAATLRKAALDAWKRVHPPQPAQKPRPTAPARSR